MTVQREPPTKLAAGWRLVERLGEGQSATVWRAVPGAHAAEPRAATTARGGAAVKLGNARFALNLAHEAERLVAACSSALPALIDAGRTSDGAPFIVLQALPGSAASTLDPSVSGDRVELAWWVLAWAARALADLHATGFAHGDVKPSNVVVAPDGRRVWLVDLGLAQAADALLPRGGTPRYLAPEIARGGASSGRARDLYALGLTVAEIAWPDLARLAPAELLATVQARGELGATLAALGADAPMARPAPSWVQGRAERVLGRDLPPEGASAVQRAYLAARWRELTQTAEGGATWNVAGAPGNWLQGAHTLLARASELRHESRAPELRRDARPAPDVSLGDLDALGRRAWLVALVGPAAAGWPASPESDAQLADRLLALTRDRAPASIRADDLFGSASPRAAAPGAERSNEELVLALATDVGAARELERRAGRLSEPLLIALARRRRLAGDLGAALALLAGAEGAAARAERAELARRAGATERAASELAEAEARAAGDQGAATPDATVAAARRAATRARLELDLGRPAAALAATAAAPPAACVAEARALALLALGDVDGARQGGELARALASDDEERARAEGLTGLIEHAHGPPAAAVRAFEAAARHAAHAGAALEEATYLTGLAAASVRTGDLGAALHAGARAALVFQALGRPADAARAWLSRAVALVALGAVTEARAAAEASIALARQGNDARCRAYAHLALADLDQAASADHVERAAQLCAEGDVVAALYVAAARLEHTGQAGLPLGDGDLLADRSGSDADARLAWWAARAARARASDADAPLVVSRLAAVGSSGAPAARGRAFAAGAALAARLADGDGARRLARAAQDAARALLSAASPEHAALLAELPWLRAVHGAGEAWVSSEQIHDIAALARGLAQRGALRPLLTQVLDALILWTGVERGLMLLRAPGGKLVPRAARNLARADLGAEQLALSRTLAEKALAEGETVVAVDAAGELSDVHQSVHALKLRSVLAVPLIARGTPLGVVYLDDRVRRGAFGQRELAWVRLVATLAAVAIADARDRLQLERAARHARRARERATSELAVREAELGLARRDLKAARGARGGGAALGAIVGESAALGDLLRLIERVGPSELPVLIAGESGSGKELVARALHELSPRARAPFVAENVAAIPESLLEATLFGHARGAFTGAVRARVGLFELADRGTLFLDEIGEMSPALQAKLLRAIERGEIMPVGSERSRRVDVRVLGATHRDLRAMVRSGAFREDLLYRLDVVSVAVPPLRERPGDVALLARHFLRRHGPAGAKLDPDALAALEAFSWPGNVRQLENEVRRALALTDGSIGLTDLTPEVAGRAQVRPGDELKLKARVDRLETELLRTALSRTGGNQTRAAELLGISRFGLQKMLRRLGVVSPAGSE